MNGHQHCGFTLLEMMLVLLLLGIGSGVIVAQLPGQAFRATEESQRLAEWLQRMKMWSMLEGRAYGLRVSVDSWQILRWRQNRWQAILPPGSGGQHLPSGWRLDLVTSAKVSTDTDMPQVLMLPGGEITPFRLDYLKDGRLMAQVGLDEGLTPRVMETADERG